jgi:serine protease Do
MMIVMVPTSGSRFGRIVRRAAHCVGIMAVASACGRPPAEGRGSGSSRIALLVAAVTAIATMGTSASAAVAPSACDGAEVVAHALSGVVNITIVKVTHREETAARQPPELIAAGKPADDRVASTPTGAQIAVSFGSGAVIDPSGIIVTNKHVIQDAAMIRVIFYDKSEVPAQLIAAANLLDLALLKVNLPRPLPVLKFGDSDALRVGQPVIAIGNPLGLGTSVSTGVVSGLNRNLMRSPFDDFIQTDASINPGNSGGPLLDCAGDIIGINTALYSNSKVLGSIGLGFALPSNVATFVAGKLRYPETDRPNWIGLHLQDLTSDLATNFGRPDLSGAIVTDVDPDSPAAQALLTAGDIITNADGRQLTDSRAVLRMVVVKPSGAPIMISVWRDGRMIQVTLRGRPWPHMMALRSDVLASAAAVAKAQAQGLGLGIHLTAITPENRQSFGLGHTSGVLIDRVTLGSQAENVGLKPGDVIEKVENKPATTPDDVMDRLAHDGSSSDNHVALLVRGKSAIRWVTVYVGRVDVSELVAAPVLANAPTPARDAAARQQ